MATITCQDCGAERTRCPRNTRYCRACRLLRDLRYWIDNRRRCGKCDAVFAPTHGRDYFCSKHTPDWQDHMLQTCALCRQERPPLIAGLAICLECGRAPHLRAKLVAALRRGQAQRLAAA